MNNYKISFSITLIIIIITCIISYSALKNSAMFNKLKHFPYQEKRSNEYFRMLSAGFVHGDMMHLIINMYVLFMFGEVVEKSFGNIYGPNSGRVVFTILYLMNIVAASIPTYFKNQNNPQFASVGASGAVSGLLFIYIILSPWAGLTFIFFPFINIPAIVLGIGYLIYSSYASKKASGRIDHMAHFYGAIFGIVFLFSTKPEMISYFFERLINDYNTFRFY